MKAISELHWLKGIRKAAAWGQVRCTTSICTPIRTALCSGSEPYIVACIYLHVQVASPFVLCLWWLWPECRHLFPHQAMHLPSGCCFPDPFQQCTSPQAAEVWGKVYHRHSELAVVASFPGLPGSCFWSLVVCKNGGRRPGESYHKICGTHHITDSRHGDIFTFISPATEKLENQNKIQSRDTSYL